MSFALEMLTEVMISMKGEWKAMTTFMTKVSKNFSRKEHERSKQE